MLTLTSRLLKHTLNSASLRCCYQIIRRNFGTETVFISGLPPVIRKSQLIKFYGKSSTGLKDARLYLDTHTHRLNGTAVLIYYKENQAFEAIRRLNHKEIVPGYSIEMKTKPTVLSPTQKAPKLQTDKNPIQNHYERLYEKTPQPLKYSKSSSSDPENTTLYITNLPKNITIMKLKRIFGVYGIILNVEVKVQVDESVAKVEFQDAEKAEEAKDQLSRILDGQGKKLFSGRVPKIQFEIQEFFSQGAQQSQQSAERLSKVNYSPVFRDDFRIKTKEEEAHDISTQELKHTRNFKPFGKLQNITIPNVILKRVVPGLTRGATDRPNDTLRPRMVKSLPPNTYNTLKGQVVDMYKKRKYKTYEGEL